MLLLQVLEKTSLSKTWRMAATDEAGETQKCKIAKTRKLENCKSQMNYQAAFSKAGENLSLHDWRNS